MVALFFFLFQHNRWLSLIKPLIFLHICNIFVVASLLIKAQPSNLNKITFFPLLSNLQQPCVVKKRSKEKMIIFQLLI